MPSALPNVKSGWLKSEAEKAAFNRISANENGIFRLAKQMDKTNRDVVGGMTQGSCHFVTTKSWRLG